MKKRFYIARGSVTSDTAFFTSKPDLIVMNRTANMIWTNAEFSTSIWFLDKILPSLMLDPGKCMLVEIESDEVRTIITIVDKDVKPKIIFG